MTGILKITTIIEQIYNEYNTIYINGLVGIIGLSVTPTGILENGFNCGPPGARALGCWAVGKRENGSNGSSIGLFLGEAAGAQGSTGSG